MAAAAASERGGPAALTFRHVLSRLPALADGTDAADEYQNPTNPSSAKISQHPVITLREIRLKQIRRPADVCRHGEQQGNPPPPLPPLGLLTWEQSEFMKVSKHTSTVFFITAEGQEGLFPISGLDLHTVWFK